MCEISFLELLGDVQSAMQLMGPSVELINPESLAIALGSQPDINMVLCPLSQPLSIWPTRRQSSPALNPIKALFFPDHFCENLTRKKQKANLPVSFMHFTPLMLFLICFFSCLMLPGYYFSISFFL